MSIFIKKNDNNIINACYINDVKRNNNIVYFYMANGEILKEEFNNDIEAQIRINEVKTNLKSISFGCSDYEEIITDLNNELNEINYILININGEAINT